MNQAAILPVFQDALARHPIDLWLQPMGDEFQGEYVPPALARLPYLTGFTGSAGLGVFWANESKKHALFVDGRYTLQAAQEVDGDAFELFNSGEVSLADWVRQQPAGLRIGFDPWLVSQQQLDQWKKSCAGMDVHWEAITPNPVDAIWLDRPALPHGEVRVHPLHFAGASYAEKKEGMLKALNGADALALTLPDGINWLLNIRGADVGFNPLLLSYFILRKQGQGELYVYGHSFSNEVNEYLANNNVVIKNIHNLFSGEDAVLSHGETLMLDPAHAAQGWTGLAAEQGFSIAPAEDPTLLPKACKNSVELEGMRAAHRRDGLALSGLLHWLDTRSASGRVPNELEVVAELEKFRGRANDYRGASFATIAGSGPHGAIVHYRADGKSNRRPQIGEIFLLDSGGQYPDGTTDVTRTVFLAGRNKVPTTAMKDHYTRVLKGHIALACAIFPEGTSGQQLDVLARQYLWRAGLDYDHGTGHGVGAYLCVHEGPQRIGKKGGGVPLREGMILSNEPGYYEAGQYGIRIENLVAVVRHGVNAQGKKLFAFETLTLVPIDTRLVEISMLNVEERNWLNAYHQRVYKAHAEGMDAGGQEWLAEVTRAI